MSNDDVHALGQKFGAAIEELILDGDVVGLALLRPMLPDELVETAMDAARDAAEGSARRSEVRRRRA